MSIRARISALVVLVVLFSSVPLSVRHLNAESEPMLSTEVKFEMRFHPPGGGRNCLACHISPGHSMSASSFPISERDLPPEKELAPLSEPSFSISAPDLSPEAELTPLSDPSFSISATDLPPEAELTHWWFGCNTCHSLHGTTNLYLISEFIDTDDLPPDYFLKSGLREVIFTNLDGQNSFADGDADGDGVYTGICEVCHTETRYHRGDSSGDHDHFRGANCTNCHNHSDYFQPTGIADHPQAITDCSNCHLNRTTQEPDLLGVHDFDCQKCHPGFDLSRTILGELGTFQGECSECHNPNNSATGNLETPTKGHRCVLCHGEQESTANIVDFHEEHTETANCVVCHGFIPDVGTQIGSGNRESCRLCHVSYGVGSAITTIHREMVTEGMSCLECHGGKRPPIDVFPGPPVGNSTVVCQICHRNQSPSEFKNQSDELHQEHVEEKLDCGFCHADAILQDDREPMPDLDDKRRMLMDRSGLNECRLCHEDERASSREVHEEHVADQWQWCYNCHEGDDQRPTGLLPPVTQPSEACVLCHNDERYRATLPFSIHKEHAGKNKCYACHQTMPQFFDWPSIWLNLSAVGAVDPVVKVGPIVDIGDDEDRGGEKYYDDEDDDRHWRRDHEDDNEGQYRGRHREGDGGDRH